MSIQEIDPKNLPKDAFILDVRMGSEHSEKALRQPHFFRELSNLNAKEFIKDFDLKDTPIYLMCKSGKRAQKAAELFEKEGYTHIFVIKGGIDNAEIEGIPLIKQSVISMERQVRILAGALVFLGTLLGIFYSSAFFILPLFIGVGLFYAGISNSCGMAKLLALFPWNKN